MSPRLRWKFNENAARYNRFRFLHSKLSDVNVNVSNWTPLDDLLESPRIDDWPARTTSRQDYPRYHRDVLILDIREARRVAVRSLGEMKAAEKRNALALIRISCLRSDVEWQLRRFDCSVHRSSLAGRSHCADEDPIVSNSVNHAGWKESWGECVRANLYLSCTGAEWRLASIFRAARPPAARKRNIFINPAELTRAR